MSFDISRSTFRPRKNFLGVVMQQGRVQLDSDWNEWQSEFARRIQAGTLDIVGRAVYPASTPNAFKITPTTNASGAPALSIGAGRFYVDGLLAENHGPKDQSTWDTALAELSGAPADSTTTASTDYTQQPYLPGATLPTGNGPFLAYLDVWERDITWLEDPNLIDKALGIDTTGRIQTVWQVKLLDLSSISGTPDCSTDIPAFDALNAPPAAQLTNGLVPNAASGPCCLAPNTGYTGQENQLYRMQVHQPGTLGTVPAGGFTYPLPAGTPTFKWSRDNASVATSVSAIGTVSTSSGSVSTLAVASLGRDSVLSFAVNDWIEILDDVYELNGQPGEMYLITGVTAASNTLTLNGTVSAHFPLTGGQTNPKLHTRIRRWDQQAQIYSTDSSGNTTPWIDLTSAGSTGDIPIPPAGTTLVLENGITVSFALNPATGSFNSGNYWTFAARTADGSIEQLTAAPPQGIFHHYARLAIVTFPSTATDCRVEWGTPSSNCNCGCTVDIAPSDITGNNTLQSVFDKYQNQSTPITICLAAGTYSLPAPLRLTTAHTNITLEACQPGSVQLQAQPGNESSFNDGLIVLDNVTAFTLSGIDLLAPVSAFTGTFAGLPVASMPADVATMVSGLIVSIGIRIIGSSEITVHNCAFGIASRSLASNQTKPTALFAAGIFASGQNDGIRIEGNQFIPDLQKEIITSDNFLAGFVLASTVSFITNVIQAVPAAPTNVSATVEEAAKTNIGETAVAPKAAEKTAKAKKAQAQVKQSNLAPRIADLPAADLSDIEATAATREPLNVSGLQIVGGQLQNIGSFGTFGTASATLASQGGTVLAATLDDSAFRDNVFESLTCAALILGEPGTIDVLSNQVAGASAGFWFITPAQTQNLLYDPQNLALLGATVALGYPLPQNDTSTTITTVAAAPSSIRIYAGSKPYTDSNGNVWSPDASATNVTVSGGTPTTPIPLASINGSSDPTLYQSERYGNSFSYTFNNLVNGYYSLTLKFAEIFYTNNSTNKGVRIFNVSINGQQVLTDFDIASDAGGADNPDDYTFTGILPNDAQQIVVQFTGTTLGSDDNAKIDAAELDPQWTGTPTLGTGNESPTATFFDQLAQIAYQGYATLGYSLARLRIDTNEMRSLTAPGVVLLGDDSLVNADSGSLMMTGNRLDGEITVDSEFAAYTGDFANITHIAFNPRPFLALVLLEQVARAVFTSNLLTNGNPTDGYGISLYLNSAQTLNPSIAVMSNVFSGNPIILPARNLATADIAAILKSWNFLNTIVT